jgi:cysteine desulfurase
MIPDYEQQKESITALNAYAKEELLKIDGVKLNSGEDASPYIINLYVPSFMTSQTVVQHLSSKYSVYVSNGSACAKGKKSHVLTAMKISDKIIDKSIRVSFSRNTTKEDIDSLVNALKETVSEYPN